MEGFIPWVPSIETDPLLQPHDDPEKGLANVQRWCRAAVVAMDAEPVDDSDGRVTIERGQVDHVFTPTDTDLDIEQAIREARAAVSQADIEAASGHPLSTIKKRLPILEKAGRVHRPHGPRSGYAVADRAGI